MNDDFGDLYNGWSESEPLDSLKVLDTWFESPVWRSICKDADGGCSDSMKVMETCSEYLCSLIFHLENDSPKARIDYEMKLFKEYVNPYLS